MHKTAAGSVAHARRLCRLLRPVFGAEIAIAPSHTALHPVSRVLKGTRIRLAAQNVYGGGQGAFTGEVSASQAKDAGCWAVLVGHSERRHIFGETDRLVNERLLGALVVDLRPVLCVGETLEQRRAGRTAAVVKRQLVKGLEGVTKQQSGRMMVAYEPVWAIGTGEAATTAQVSRAHDLIRRQLAGLFGRVPSNEIRILYGGSVTPRNIGELAAIKNLDGVLVGGASLKADEFAMIVKTVAKAKKEE